MSYTLTGVAMSNGTRGSAGQMSEGSNHSEGSSQSALSGEGEGDPDIIAPPERTRVVSRDQRDQAEAWWSVGEYLDGKNLTHQSARFSLTGNRVFGNQREEVWDLSDSLLELYETIQRTEGGGGPQQIKRIRNAENKNRLVDINDWISKDISHGFVRVYAPDMSNFLNSRLVPLTLSTTVQQVTHSLGLSMNALHVQVNGDIIRRMDAYEHPLVLQNEYLTGLGFDDVTRIQEEGAKEEMGYLIRFYSGKPLIDSTFSRNQLQGFLEIKKGGVLQNWIRKLCVLSGTRLLIYKDKYKRSSPHVIQLAKGAVEEAKFKGHDFCLRLTSTLSGSAERVFYISFTTETDYNKWYKKCKKATDKLPTSADLSNCHLEFLPENIFVNDQLAMLNLRHNVLKERPIEEDIFIIGWLDDLSRFSNMRSLNLADNNLLTFPLAVCHIHTLVELNIASNKLEEIPPDIAELSHLQALHVHNNHLTFLPPEMMHLRKLFILVLAFNRFTTVPPVVAQMTNIRISDIENIIMAGNRIKRIPSETLMEMKYVKKVDLRMNQLTLVSNETMKFTVLEHLTHLDIRDNNIRDLDIRPLRTLEYLNCERNDMVLLRMNGLHLKNLFAAQNCLEVLNINPKPEYLHSIDVSYNQLTELPDWVCDCFFLQKINVGFNLLTELPGRLFMEAQKLKILRADHNQLRFLAAEVDVMSVEEVLVNHNLITELPQEFFINANKLRVFNASKNRLMSLPPVNRNPDLNKLQELYLTANSLGDSCMSVISGFPRLKVLHLAHNEIRNIHDRDISQLELLQEMNISGNELVSLPKSAGALGRLVILRAHSNILNSLPDFHHAKALRVLDVGHNQLFNISVTSLMASQLNLLDMSLNTQLKVDPREFRSVRNSKSVCLVDATGQNRDLPGLKRQSANCDIDENDPNIPWKVGFSETSGIRNKLCVGALKMPKFQDDNQAFFGMFDGGHNNEIPNILIEKLPDILKAEMAHSKTGDKYMKYAMLTAHRCLRATGQKLGASAAILHVQRTQSEHLNHFSLQLANVGDVEIVLCRHGEALLLTRKFVTQEDLTECDRIQETDGIVTEDCKVNGVTKNTRMLGCAFLYPHLIPCPYTCEMALRNDDEFLIIANKGLWKYLSYGHAVEEIYEIGHPVVAAKRLQDLAQGYGSKEHISILVIRLNTDKGPSLGRLRQPIREMSVDDVEAAAKHEAKKAKKMAHATALKQAEEFKLELARRERQRSQKSKQVREPSPVTAPLKIKLERKPMRPVEADSGSTLTGSMDGLLSSPQSTEQSNHITNGLPKQYVDENANFDKRTNNADVISDLRLISETDGKLQTDNRASVNGQEPHRSSHISEVELEEPLEGSPSMDTVPSISKARLSQQKRDLRPLPNQRFVKKNAAQEWEQLLQKRLSSEIKDKELEQAGSTILQETDVDTGTVVSPGSPPPPSPFDTKDSDMLVIETIGRKEGKKILEDMDVREGEPEDLKISPRSPTPAPGLKQPVPAAQPWYAGHNQANPAYSINPGASDHDFLQMVGGAPPKQQPSVKKKPGVRSRIAMFENLTTEPGSVRPSRKREESRKMFFSPARTEPKRPVDVPPPRRCMSPPPNLHMFSRPQSEVAQNKQPQMLKSLQPPLHVTKPPVIKVDSRHSKSPQQSPRIITEAPKSPNSRTPVSSAHSPGSVKKSLTVQISPAQAPESVSRAAVFSGQKPDSSPKIPRNGPETSPNLPTPPPRRNSGKKNVILGRTPRTLPTPPPGGSTSPSVSRPPTLVITPGQRSLPATPSPIITPSPSNQRRPDLTSAPPRPQPYSPPLKSPPRTTVAMDTASHGNSSKPVARSPRSATPMVAQAVSSGSTLDSELYSKIKRMKKDAPSPPGVRRSDAVSPPGERGSHSPGVREGSHSVFRATAISEESFVEEVSRL